MNRFQVLMSGVFLMAVSPLAMAAPETFKIDTAHSSIVFKIMHSKLAYSYGRFNEFSGTVVRDKENEAGNSVQLEIKADSIDTANKKRDDHLRNADFLNTPQFPAISLKSTGVKKVSDTEYDVTADMTMKGITKPVSFKLKITGEGEQARGGYKAGAEATFVIKRSDFGITYGADSLGEEITVMTSIEAARQDAPAAQ